MWYCQTYPKDGFDATVKNNKLQNLILIGDKIPELLIEKIYEAQHFRYVEMVDYLVSKGAKLQEIFDKYPHMFITHAKWNHIEIIECILNNTAFSQEQLDEYLKKAYDCSPEYVDMLIDAGADFVEYGELLYVSAKNNCNKRLV